MPFSLDTGDTFGSGDAEVNGGMGEASIAEAVGPVDEANGTIPWVKLLLRQQTAETLLILEILILRMVLQRLPLLKRWVLLVKQMAPFH